MPAPRVLAREVLRAKDSLVDLEHERLYQLMVEQPAELLTKKELRIGKTPKPPPLGAYSWHVMPQLHLTGVLIQRDPFRQQLEYEITLALLPDEGGETWTLHRVDDGARRGEKLYVPVEESLLVRVALEKEQGERIQPWGATDYLTALADLAEDLDISLDRAARSFGTVTASARNQRWGVSPGVGVLAEQMRLSVLVNISERFTCECLYASKRISAVIRKPGETREIRA